MSAKLFFLPYSTATVNGIAQPGAQLFFYQTGTLTKLPIYTTDLLDVQLTNPVIATGAGRFPDIYLDSTQTYRLIVKDRIGATLDDIDPFIPGTIAALIRDVGYINASDYGSDAIALQAAIDASYAAKNVDNTGYGVGTGPPVYVPYNANFNIAGTKIVISHTMRLFGDSNGMPTASGSVITGNGTNTGIEIGTTAEGTIIEGLTFNGGWTDAEGEFHAIKRLTTAKVRDCNFRAWPGDAVNDDENVGGGTTNGSDIQRIFVEDVRCGHKALGGDANAGYNAGIEGKNTRQALVYQGGFLGDHYYSCSSNNAAFTAWNTGAAGHPASYCHSGGRWYAVMIGQETWCQTNPPYSSTVTITIASPGVVTWTAHGLTDGTPVSFSTTGALPTGLTAATTYYVVSSSTNTFQVAATAGGAAINTSGSQSGTHTSGAAKSNTGWIHWTVGAAQPSTGVPTWFNNMVCRAGGSYLHTNANNRSTFTGCYAEDTNPAQFDIGAVLVGPLMTAWLVTGGAYYGLKDSYNGNSLLATFAGAGGYPVQLGRTQIQSTSGSVTAMLWNSGPIASGVFSNLVFTQGLEADAVTPLSVARIGAYHTSTSPATAEGVIYFGTRTLGGTGAYTDWIQLDGANKMWTPITTNQMDLGYTSIRWKNLYLSGDANVAGGVFSTSASSGVGYATGAGAAVTQLTSKSTATPAINRPCGQVTMNNAALAAGAKVSFVVTNSVVAATDTVLVSVASGGTANAYRAAVTAISAGASFTVTVENITAGSLSEAPVINFSVLKAVAA